MSDDRPITPEQALLAVKAAGLDPDKSLSEQLTDDHSGDLEQRIADLSEQVRTLSEALEAGQSADPQSRERRFAEILAAKLNEAQSPSFTYGGPDAA